MRRLRLLASALVAAVLLLLTRSTAGENRQDWRAVAAASLPRWSERESCPLWSVVRASGYTFEISKLDKGPLDARILKGDHLLHQWEIGTHGTPFLVHDGVLYYSVVPGWSSGCTIVAHSLRDRKELWRSQLTALGPIEHTKYTNFGINMRLHGSALRVDGKEAGGRYIEFVARDTGAILASKVVQDGR